MSFFGGSIIEIQYSIVISHPQNQSVTENLTIYIGPGTYKPTNEVAIAVIDSSNISLVGAGGSQTVFQCGGYKDGDSPCSYMNFQIRASRYVFVSGFTFTRCGPITSAFYISSSDHVVIKDCVFR